MNFPNNIYQQQLTLMHPQSPRKITIRYQQVRNRSGKGEVNSPQSHQHWPTYKLTSTRATSPSTVLTTPKLKDTQWQGQENHHFSPSERSQYEKKMKMAIEEIDRLNHLLSVKMTQISVLNNHCMKITKQLKERNQMLEENGRLEQENRELKAQLYRKEQIISSLSNRDLRLFSIERMESQNSLEYGESVEMKPQTLEQLPNEKLNQFMNSQHPLEKKIIELQQYIESLQEQLGKEEEQREQKQRQVRMLMEKICLCEEHILYIEQQNHKGNNKTLENDYWTVKQKYQDLAGEHDRLLNKIGQLQSEQVQGQRRIDQIKNKCSSLDQ